MTHQREAKQLQHALRTISTDAIVPEIAQFETGAGLWCLVDERLAFVPASGARTETMGMDDLTYAQFVRWVNAHPERIHPTHDAAVAFVRSVLYRSQP